MKCSVTVPAEKVMLLQKFVKKMGTHIDPYEILHFTPQGIYADFDTAVVFIPVDIDFSEFKNVLSKDVFSISCYSLLRLSNAKSDVVFTFDEKTVKPCYVSITYTEQIVVKQITEGCIVGGVSIKGYEIPAETIESSKFLSAVTSCMPYCDKRRRFGYDSEFDLDMICLENDIVGAVSGHSLFVAKNMDLGSLFSGVSDTRFLLWGVIASLLPKSGTCRLALEGEKKRAFRYSHDVRERSKKLCLCIGFPDYHIFVINCKGEFPNLKKQIQEPERSTNNLCIDDRDRQICVKQMEVLPKGLYNSETVYLHTEDGRFCIDSCSSGIAANVRLRFSEFTTGTLPPIYIDGSCLREALQHPITNMYHGTQLKENKENKKTEIIDILFLESDDVVIEIVSVEYRRDKQMPIIDVVELRDHWIPEKPVKKLLPKKQPQCSSLFVNTDRELIAKLRLENEQLKKENEQLRNELQI
jgi:hypothetical protein